MWHIHLAWILFTSFICLLGLLCLFRREIHLRLFGMKSSMNSVSALWIANGIKKDRVNEVLSKIRSIEGTGRHSWVYEFSQNAKKLYKKQIVLNLDPEKHTDHNTELLQQIYFQSSLWFGIAKYPHCANNESKNECFKMHKLCYHRAMNMKTDLVQFEEIRIETKGPNKQNICGYLHQSVVSREMDNAFIIMIGSIDIWKGDLWFIVEELLQQNMSVFTIDLAGTGDINYKLDINALYIYQDIIKYFKKMTKRKRYRLNMDNLGIFGVGFGAYFAVRLAQKDCDDDIKFVVNLSGPLIYTFNQEWIFKMDESMVKALCFALSIKRESKRNLSRVLKMWKLSNFDDASLGDTKILNIFGKRDSFINPLDGDVFSNDDNAIVFENNGYCCTQSVKQWLPNASRWILNDL